MDELSIAQAKINQLTRRIEELEEIVRVAREHALDQQTQNDLLEQDATNRCFCEKCEEYLHERYCADCYAEMVSENEDDEMSDDDTQPNSPASKIIQDWKKLKWIFIISPDDKSFTSYNQDAVRSITVADAVEEAN